MPYLFEKYGVDSLQFVESDRYYASIPVMYEEIYLEVKAELEKKHELIKAAKQRKDSLKLLESQARRLAKKNNLTTKDPAAAKTPTDSLP